ncbi:hypothetical protein BGW42_004758 [Actinomortierella wolfii]|nr:hypothetical protein BGW42_004758 [Actinomortierella wolfii]
MDNAKPIADHKVVQSSPSPLSNSKNESSGPSRPSKDDATRSRYPSAVSAISSSPSPARDRSASRSGETWSPRNDKTTPSRERGSIVQGMINKFQHENTLSPPQPLRQRTQRSTGSIQQNESASPITSRTPVAQQYALSPTRSTLDFQLRTPKSSQRDSNGEEGSAIHRGTKDFEPSPLTNPSNSYSAVSGGHPTATTTAGDDTSKLSASLAQPKDRDVSPLELFPSLGALDAAGLLASSKADASLSDLQLQTLTPIEPRAKLSFSSDVQPEDLAASKQSKSKLAMGWKKLRKSIRPNSASGPSSSKRDAESSLQQQQLSSLSCVSVEPQSSLPEGAAIPERKTLSDVTTTQKTPVQALGSDFGPEFSLTFESLGSTFGSEAFQGSSLLNDLSSPPLAPPVPTLSTDSNASTKDVLTTTTTSKTVTKTPAIVTTAPDDEKVVDIGPVLGDIETALKDKVPQPTKGDNTQQQQQKQQQAELSNVRDTTDSKQTTVAQRGHHSISGSEASVVHHAAETQAKNAGTQQIKQLSASALPIKVDPSQKSNGNGIAVATPVSPPKNAFAAVTPKNSMELETSESPTNFESEIRVEIPPPPRKGSIQSVDQGMLPSPLSPTEEYTQSMNIDFIVESHEIHASLPQTVSPRAEPHVVESRLNEALLTPSHHTGPQSPPRSEKRLRKPSIETTPRAAGSVGIHTSRREEISNERSPQVADAIAEKLESTEEPGVEDGDLFDNAFKVPLSQSVQLASAMFGNGKRIPLSVYYVSEELRVRDLAVDISELFPLTWHEADPKLEKLLAVFDNRPFGQGYDLSETPKHTPVLSDNSEQSDSELEDMQTGVSSRHLSCVILWFLKELPEPLLSKDILTSLSNVALLQTSDEVKSKAAAALVQALPHDNLHLLQFLVEFVDLAILCPIQHEIQQSREALAQILDNSKQLGGQPDTNEARLHDLRASISERQDQFDNLKSRIAQTLAQVFGGSLNVDSTSHLSSSAVSQVVELLIRQRHSILGPDMFSSSEEDHDGDTEHSQNSSSGHPGADNSTAVFLEEDDRGYHSDTMVNRVTKSARKSQKRIIRSLRLRLAPHGDDTVWELDERGAFSCKKQVQNADTDVGPGQYVDLMTLRNIHERIRQMHKLSNRHQRRNSAATVHSMVADAHSVADVEEEDRVAAIERTNQGLADALNGRPDTPSNSRSQPKSGASNVLQRLGFRDISHEPQEQKKEQKELKMVEKEILQSEAISRHLASSLSGLYPSTTHTPIPLRILPSARKQIQLNAAMAAASFAAAKHLTKSIPPPAEHVYANAEDNKDPRVRPCIEKVWKPQEPIVIPSDHQEGNIACPCTYCKHIAKPSRITFSTPEENEVAELKAECEAKEQHVTELLKTVHDLQGQVNILNAKLLFLHDHHTTRPMRRRALSRRSLAAMTLSQQHQHQQSQQQQISAISTESSDERRFQQLHLHRKEARRGSVNSQGSSLNESHPGANPYSPQSSDITMHRAGTPGTAPNLPTPQSLMASPGYATPSSLLRAFPDGVSLANNVSTNPMQHSHASTSSITTGAKDPALRHHKSLPLFGNHNHSSSTANASMPSTDMDVPEFVLDEDDTMSHLDLEQDQYFPQHPFTTLVDNRSQSQLGSTGRPVTPSTRSSTVVSFGNTSYAPYPPSSSTPFRVESELELVLRDMEEAEEAEVYEREGEDQADEYYYADAYKPMDQRLYRRPVLPVPQAPPPMSAEQYKRHQRMSLPIHNLMSRRINIANTFKRKSTRPALA